ncbi:MAG TPA: TonB-dependent receptor [Hymenobacter sp.]|jgi:iron complex outermembrane receptor protein|uniref:TonB-dependent receptor n=1 Tax=Hymenobacter sp. TaxID=1898978 RepID=UPI002EDA2B23
MRLLTAQRLVLFSLLLLLPTFLWAADPGRGVLSGTVRTADGQPAPFVSVALKGTAVGTTTDERGFYRLAGLAPGTYTLVVQGLGYDATEQQVEINDQATADVALAQTTRELSEVQVLGQKRRTASATRTVQELIDIPMSIQVIGQDVVQQQNAFDLATLTRNISGVNLTGTYAGQDSYQFFNARGFNLNNSQNYRRNGLMVWNMGAHFNDNIESVEFLKGPAAILFGDVAPGGVMNFVTKKPLNYDYRRLELKVGEYGLVRPTLDLSGPINEKGSLLYRVNTTYQQSNSFRDQVRSNAVMFAPSLTWNVTPRLSWNVEYTLKKTESSDDPGLVSPTGTFEGLRQLPHSRYLGEPRMQYGFTDQAVYSTLTYQLSDTWRVRNLSSYGYTTRSPYGLSLSQPDEVGNISRYEYNSNQWFDTRTVALDLTGTVQTGPVKHTLLFGADYFDTNSRFTESAGYNLIDSTFNVFNPRYNQACISFDNSTYSPFRFFYERVGVYAQDQLSVLNDKVQVLLGLRLNRTRQGNKYDNPADRPTNVNPIATARPISPRIGLVYKPMPWLSAFASYTNSYEVNAPADYVGAVNENAIGNLEPTVATQYEAGVKANLLRERLGATLTAFHIEKNNITGTYYENRLDPAAADFRYFVYSGGQHRSRGLELDVNGRVTPELALTASASLIDARIVDDPAYTAGNRLAGAPRTGFSVWADYQVPLRTLKGLTLGYGVFNRAGYYGTNENLYRTRGYTTQDAAVGYAYKQFSTRLSVTNLTDRRYFLQNFSPTTWEPQWVRRAVLSLAVKF